MVYIWGEQVLHVQVVIIAFSGTGLCHVTAEVYKREQHAKFMMSLTGKKYIQTEYLPQMTELYTKGYFS